MPQRTSSPAHEPRSNTCRSFHHMPIINGYSGYYPDSYLSRLDRVRGMPDEAALQKLVGENVRYVIVHRGLYRKGAAEEVILGIQSHSQFRDLGHFDDGLGGAVAFAVR